MFWFLIQIDNELRIIIDFKELNRLKIDSSCFFLVEENIFKSN
jgi:hypothetical protein